MKILAFIFIQLGGLLLYCAHASNIEPTFSPSIEHLFSPHVTISKDRKLTKPDFTIYRDQEFFSTKFGTDGAFNPINMPFYVKGPSGTGYEVYSEDMSPRYTCSTNGIPGNRSLRGITYKIGDVDFLNNGYFSSLGSEGKENITLQITFPSISSSENIYIKELLKRGGECGGKFRLKVQASGI